MSIRPKRRAAYQQNYNEDDLFLEQTYIEHPPIKSQPVSPHRFVEPRNRIPQQRVQQDAFLRHPKRPQMKRFSLKTYLTAKIPSKRVKTRLCGSKRLSLVDMRSYDEILSSKRRIIQNKRRRKEDLKNVGIQLEKEKHFSQVFSPDFGVHGTSQSLLDSNFVPMNFHAQGITEYERANYSKVARDPVNNSKKVCDETSKALDETEKKSTVISCYDRPQNKGPGENGLGIDPEFMGHGSPNIDSHGSMEINDSSNNSNNQNNECLIDQLWEENERECEEIIGDSLHDF